MTTGDVIIRSNSVDVEGDSLNVKCRDIQLIDPALEINGARVALRHIEEDEEDYLVINGGNSYPGGTKVNGVLEVSRIRNTAPLEVDSKLVANGRVDVNGQLWVNQGNLRVINHDNLPSEDENDDRRALFHSASDQLIVNFTGEYTGGTRVDGNLKVNGILEAKDIKNPDERVTIECDHMKVNGWNIQLDQRSETDQDGLRRALRHTDADTGNDKLTINYGGDYPGGTEVDGNLKVNGILEAKDIKNPDGKLTVECGNFNVRAYNIMLDHPDRRPEDDKEGFRRALVHGTEDRLIINYGGEYTGGTEVDGNLVTKGRLDVSGDLEVAGQLAVNVFEWPAWPGETPIDENLELINEIRRMKEEILSLRSEVDSLTKSKTIPDALQQEMVSLRSEVDLLKKAKS